MWRRTNCEGKQDLWSYLYGFNLGRSCCTTADIIIRGCELHKWCYLHFTSGQMKAKRVDEMYTIRAEVCHPACALQPPGKSFKLWGSTPDQLNRDLWNGLEATQVIPICSQSWELLRWMVAKTGDTSWGRKSEALSVKDGCGHQKEVWGEAVANIVSIKWMVFWDPWLPFF